MQDNTVIYLGSDSVYSEEEPSFSHRNFGIGMFAIAVVVVFFILGFAL